MPKTSYRTLIVLVLSFMGVFIISAFTVATQNRLNLASQPAKINLPENPADFLLVSDVIDYENETKMNGARLRLVDGNGKIAGEVSNPRIKYAAGSGYAFTKRCLWLGYDGILSHISAWPEFSDRIFSSFTCIRLDTGQPMDTHVGMGIMLARPSPALGGTGVIFGSSSSPSLVSAGDDGAYRIVDVKPTGFKLFAMGKWGFNFAHFRGRYIHEVRDSHITGNQLLVFDEQSLRLLAEKPLGRPGRSPEFFEDEQGLFYTFRVSDSKGSRNVEQRLVRLDAQLRTIAETKLPAELTSLEAIGPYKGALYFASLDRPSTSIWAYRDNKVRQVWVSSGRTYRAVLKPKQDAIFILPWKRGGEITVFSLITNSARTVKVGEAIVYIE